MHDPIKGQSEHEKDRQVAVALWKPVGSFGFLVSLALIMTMAKEKTAPDTLKLVDLDPYAVTLFGIPLLSAILVAVVFIGRAYARTFRGESRWAFKVPPIVEGLSGSSLHRPVTLVMFAAFVLLPWFALGRATFKFFDGRYYYASVASAGCNEAAMSQSCECMGNRLKHFRPKHGTGSWTNTPYRYEGNKTYIPVVFPSFFLGLALWVSLYCAAYVTMILRREHVKD
jgi:hypothetical protein